MKNIEENEWNSTTTSTTVEKTEICYSVQAESSNFVGEPSTSSSLTHEELKNNPKLPRSLNKAVIDRGFKHYGHRMRLYCRTGFCLMIFSDGKVLGDELGNHPAGVLEFTSAGLGEVRIRAVEANLYLAMNQSGNLYGEEDPRNYATVFIESLYNEYNTYLSQKYAHMGWYIGIKKNGTVKKGPLTKWGQKAIQFLPVRA